MNDLIKVSYDTEQPTVSARDLHEKLNIGTKFTTWFERMCEYGFTEGNEFFPKLGETSEQGGRPSVDYDISVDMAKQICMIQRTPEGKQCRQYLIDLEKAWNTPEQIMARALRMADQTIENLKKIGEQQSKRIEEMRPKEIFADAVASSHTSILVGDLAKILKQNGIEIGQKRLFERLRKEGFLIKGGTSKNMPTQRAMEMGLFEVKEGSYVDSSGRNITAKTTKVTGRGQQYFINRYLAAVEI